ncbi:MAG: DNA-3-methyladenine glycosylase 2 family protein [Clostridiaceae bacterium]
MNFKYTKKELKELIKKDPVLGERIKKMGPIERETTPDLFEALMSSIVSQQIAKKAYFTVWGRLKELLDYEITPDKILQTDRQSIKDCGLSYKKTDWIIEISRRIFEGETKLDHINELTDEELTKELVKLPGIGLWTSEMLMIFALNRMDILSYGDFAIRKGMMRVYGLEALDKKTFNEIKERLSPLNSLASLYFWEISAE